MKIYWATPGFDDWPLQRWQVVLAALAKNGFSGIEPLISGPYTLKSDEIRALLEAHNLELFGVRTGGISLKHKVFFNDLPRKKRKEAVERFQEVAHYITQFGCPRLLTGLIQGNLYPGQSLAEAESRIGEALAECAQSARADGLEINLEAVNRFEVNHHNQCAQMADFIVRLKMENIRLLIDSFHMNIEEAGIQQAVDSVKHAIGHVHLADSNRRVPGKGHFDFAGFFGALKSAGYKASLSVEAQTDASLEEIESTALFLKQLADCEVDAWI